MVAHLLPSCQGSKVMRKRVIKSFRDFRLFYFNKKPAVKSTLVQRIMPPSDTSSKSSSNAFTYLSIRREQRASQVYLRPDQEERRVHRAPQRSGSALIQGPTFQSLKVASRNQTRMRTRNHHFLTNFGPYENANINDSRKLPFDIQHSVAFQMCILLEGAIFDFTKKWAPVYLVRNNLTSAKQVELNLWNRLLVRGIIPLNYFEDRDTNS